MTRITQRGFTLVELMMTIAVLGILVAVAVPLYNDYQTRARVAQVLTTIDTLRTVFHAEYETEGEIPRFSPGKTGEIPPELASLPIGPELLRFDFLDEHLIQSSHHYGPFEGKDIPYLMLVARDATQSRHLVAVAHALPHSAYAWIIEPKAMVVPLLDATTRHETIANARQPAVVAPVLQPPATPQLQPQPVPQPKPQATPQAQPQPLPQDQPPTPTAQTASGNTGTGNTGTGSTSPGSQASSRQQYDDCVAHVLAGHPHGHAWGLLKQCDRYLH